MQWTALARPGRLLGGCARRPRRLLGAAARASSLRPAEPEPDYSPWKDRRVVAICGSTAALMLGHGVASPILPLYATELGASAASVGLALSAFGLARLLLNVPVGLAADRLKEGPRPLLVGGALVAGLGTAACGFATDSTELLAARFVAGAGNAVYLGATQIYLSGELSTPSTRARVLGANHSCLLFGVSAGPMLGGFLADATSSLRAPWFSVAALNLVAAAHAALALPQRLSSAHDAPKTTEPEVQGSWREIIHPRFVVAGVAHASTFALRQGGRNLLLALTAVELFGYTPRELGMLFGGMAVVDLLAVGLSARCTDAVSDRRLVIVPGIIGASAGCAWVGSAAILAQGACDTTGSLHALFLGGVSVWSLSTAALGPALPAYAADLSPSTQRGLSLALFRSFGDVGFVITPIALGYLADSTSPPLAMVTLAAMTASSGIAFAAVATPLPTDRSVCQKRKQ